LIRNNARIASHIKPQAKPNAAAAIVPAVRGIASAIGQGSGGWGKPPRHQTSHAKKRSPPRQAKQPEVNAGHRTTKSS